MANQFDIEVVHYADDGVWVATSEDISGLTVEADTFSSFVEELIDVSTELLAHNHGLTEDEIGAAIIHVKELRHVSNSTQRQSARTRRRKASPPPKLMFDDIRELAAA